MSIALKLLPTLALSFLSMIGPVCADFREGEAAHNNGDYATAVNELKPLAEQGDPRAQILLSQMYYTGRGVAHDYQAVAGWFRLAAAQGDTIAQVKLGKLYADGVGVSRNYALAHKCV